MTDDLDRLPADGDEAFEEDNTANLEEKLLEALDALEAFEPQEGEETLASDWLPGDADETPDQATNAEADTATDLPGDDISTLPDDELDNARPHPPDMPPPLDLPPFAGADSAEETPTGVPAALGSPERLRIPRAEMFRRRVRAQISMAPLAAYLLALGLFLTIRAQDVSGLPDIADATLVGGLVLVVASTLLLHGLAFGRQERGLLFLGSLIWVGAGLLALLVLGIEPEPEATEWWPLGLVMVGGALLLTFVLERPRDRRMVLLAMAVFVASGIAFAYTTEPFDHDLLDEAADYWPLLISALGIILLPLVFRQRTG
ncbi:MAG: hypothetical protein GYB65_10725 [Chloroflexi bacterium]|nr:hypothetical protein [Chloroflexota bacterium]